MATSGSSSITARVKQPHKVGGAREAVVRRLWRTVDRQAREIDARLTAGQTPAERESDARLMAALVKTLAELSALEATANEPRGKHGARSPRAAEHDQSGDDENGPIAIEELRRELASRLAALADEEAVETAGEPDAETG